jgi:hypothetical protein
VWSNALKTLFLQLSFRFHLADVVVGVPMFKYFGLARIADTAHGTSGTKRSKQGQNHSVMCEMAVRIALWVTSFENHYE